MHIFSRHKKSLIALVLLGLLLLPSAAHAVGFWELAKAFTGVSATQSSLEVLAPLVQTVLSFFQYLLVKAIVVLGGILNWAITLNANGGGAVVGASWRILRDLCNMAFIVVIILTSFGTVFNTFQIGFLKQYSIYNPKLISNFLIAAIAMNFSLAIGQGIVALSDHVTDTMVGIVGKDVAGQVAQSLQVTQLVGSFDAPAADLSVTPPTGRTDDAATNDDAKRLRNTGWENQFLGSYLNCIKTNGGIPAKDTCYHVALLYVPKLPYPEVATAAQRAYSQAQGAPPPVEETGGLWRFVGIGGDIALSQDVQTSGLAKTTEQVAASIYSVFLLMVIGLSFLAADIFAFVRIPAIWLTLVLSPLAWVGLLFPNLKTWEEWWKQFMAWNIFSPLYLFIIYIGLYLINQQPNLLAQLGTSSTFSAQVGILLFYVMTGIIFIGGTAAVLKVAFAGGSYAGNVFGAISGGLGIKGTSGAAGAIYRGIGLEPRVSGAAKGLASTYQGLPIVGPRALARRREEVEAKYQAKFGERGALETLERKRIEEQSKKNKDTGVSIAKLRDDFSLGTKGGPKYFAAAKALLDEGELSDKEMTQYAKEASKISPQYAQATRETIQKKVKEKFKEKKYRKVDDVLDVMQQLGLDKKPANDREVKSFLGSLKSNQPLLYAKLAGQTKLITNEAGQPMTTSEVLEDVAAKLSDEDVLTIFQEKIPLGENAEYFYNSKLSGKGNAKLLRLANKDLRAQLQEEIKARVKSKKQAKPTP